MTTKTTHTDPFARSRLEGDTVRLLAQAMDALGAKLREMDEQELRGIGLLAAVIREQCTTRDSRHFRSVTGAVLQSL